MKTFFLLILISLSSLMFGQTEDAWVYFNDKPNAATYLANPLTMLSQRAIDRRIAQGIPFDDKDVPLYPSYVNQISDA
ncbi:MAG TPA: peptidase S8, partial [Saprospiraceae bacterium]|nr:peptidase S8 [Saprospiraceae bacterium]